MDRKLRVGIVGAGAQGQGWAALSHLPALAVLPQFELAAVCTTNADSAAAAARKYHAARGYHDVATMAKEADLDLVSVVVKVPSHRECVMAALDAGRNVYCEWPLGASLAEAEAMAARAKEKKVHAVVGLQARADPAIRYLRDLVADGYLGEVVAVSMSMFTGGVLERPASRLWDKDKTKGVSALTVRGIHTMDAMCWCLGEFAEVAAKVTTQVRQWKVTGTGETVDVDAPDNVAVTGILEGGAIASVHVATVPFSASGFRMEIYGNKGTIRATTSGSPQRDACELAGAQGNAKLAPLPVPERYMEMPAQTPLGPPRNVGHLYLRMEKAIRDGVSVQPDFDVAVARHRLIDAIEQASDQGRTIRLR
ncbi:MAG TPA: Gfo/Idh/MocA family oxidoreductase [Casimicrobiaceae bacterium]|nr:Gfo/Idh/MocA family oxidoreductase [Casimicrobiaceae bacterium]